MMRGNIIVVGGNNNQKVGRIKGAVISYLTKIMEIPRFGADFGLSHDLQDYPKKVKYLMHNPHLPATAKPPFIDVFVDCPDLRDEFYLPGEFTESLNKKRLEIIVSIWSPKNIPVPALGDGKAVEHPRETLRKIYELAEGLYPTIKSSLDHETNLILLFDGIRGILSLEQCQAYVEGGKNQTHFVDEG